MRFPTLSQLDAERDQRLAAEGWHRWFAWRPIVIDGYCHWLEIVERKYKQNPYFSHLHDSAYRAIKKREETEL